MGTGSQRNKGTESALFKSKKKKRLSRTNDGLNSEFEFDCNSTSTYSNSLNVDETMFNSILSVPNVTFSLTMPVMKNFKK